MGGGNSRSHQRLDRHRHINAVSSVRRVKDSSYMCCRSGAPGAVTMDEGETNSDMGLANRNWVLLQLTHRMYDVFSFNSVDREPTSEGVHIRTYGTDYDYPRNQSTYILVRNRILFFGDELDHTLLNLNHIRNYSIPFWDNPFDRDRVILIEISEKLDIPLITKGTNIGFMS